MEMDYFCIRGDRVGMGTRGPGTARDGDKLSSPRRPL